MTVLKLNINENGRDFVVGDIHGHFTLFEELLIEIKFDPKVDRMLSVGDHIDRGPESQRALEFLKKPWFHSVRGNHEAMLLASREMNLEIHEVWMRNGGRWAEELDAATLDEFKEAYVDLPYLIQVETPFGLVGIVHADIPPDLFDWPKLVKKIENKKIAERQLQTLLWSRESYRKQKMMALYPGSYHEPTVKDVHKVYIGHSIVNQATLFGNLFFIDTGAYIDGFLTAVDLTSEEVISIPALKFDSTKLDLD